MFWTKLAGAVPFLFQVIVVVALVVVFAFFDPFGLLISTKLKLKDTPVDVRSIKDIGQLITAEYYGEVVQSYAFKVKEENKIQVEELEGNLIDIHRQFVSTIDILKEDFSNKDLRKRDILKEYRRLMGTFLSEEDYPLYIYYVNRKVADKNYKIRHLDNEIRDSQEETLVSKLVRQKKYDSPPTQGNDYIKDLLAVYHSELRKVEAKKLKRSNLVMLGRGWVKAGFDFGKFTEDNFRYNENHNSIYFIGLNPQILSATINPWFIPEKGVEGFEFLIVERKIRRDYKVVQEVKQMCLDELKRKAFERDILKKAVTNARTTMKEFFSLLLEEPVDRVTFYENELEFTFDEIFRNDTISGEELILIDGLLRKDSLIGIEQHEMPEARQVFLDSIQARVTGTAKIFPYTLNGQVVNSWKPEYAMLYAVTKDHIFNESDFSTIGTYGKYYCDTVNVGSDASWAGSCKNSFDLEIKKRVEMLLISAETFSSRADQIASYRYKTDTGFFWSSRFPNNTGQLEGFVSTQNSNSVIWVEEVKGNSGGPVALQIEMDENKDLFDFFISEERRTASCQCADQN